MNHLRAAVTLGYPAQAPATAPTTPSTAAVRRIPSFVFISAPPNPQYSVNEKSVSPAATSMYWCPSSMYVSGAFDTWPDVRVPQDLAVGRIVGHEVAAQIAGEQQLARGGQHSAASLRRRCRDSDAARPPCRSYSRSRSDSRPSFPGHPPPCRPAPSRREDRFRSDSTSRSFVLRHVEQAGVGTVGGRRPVGAAAVGRRDQRACRCRNPSRDCGSAGPWR